MILAAFMLAGVFRFPVNDFRESLLVLFHGAVVISLAACLWSINKWIALFLCYAFYSKFSPLLTVHSSLAFLDITIGVVWFMLIVQVFTADNVGYLMDAMIIIACVHVAFQILQYFNLDPLLQPRFSDFDVTVGLMSMKNEISALLAFAFPACLRSGRKKYIPIILVGLWLSRSFGGPVAVGIGMLFYLTLTGHYWYLLIILVAISTLFIWDVPSFRRLTAWENALKFYQNHWIGGHGIGHWKPIFSNIRLIPDNKFWKYLYAHNEYLQQLFEMGVAFGVLLIGYTQEAIRKFNRDALIPATALIIIAVNCIYHFGFHVGTTAMFALTWMAIYDIQSHESRNA